MNCEELKDVYELYALGVLEGEEKSEVDAHMARGCETCTGNLRKAAALNSIFLGQAAGTAAAAPSKKLKRRILASVGIERAGWGWAAALAAACLLVITAWLSVEERHRAADLADARRTILEVSAQRDRMLTALSFLNQPETQQVGFGKGQAAPPRGNVFVNPRSGVLLVASNLPVLGPGRIFEMWIIPKGGTPRPAGLFQGNAVGSAFHILNGPVDLPALGAVAVTEEPEAGSNAPTSQPIIVAPVAGL
jgi:anti-sigma-K factor RskA